MKKIKKILFLFLFFLNLFSCKQEDLPVPKYPSVNNNTTTADTVDYKEPLGNDSIVVLNPDTTYKEDTIVISEPAPITVTNIKFLINFYDDDLYQNVTFRVYDENWNKFATLTSTNIIAVNSEPWACNPIHKIVTYTDNNYISNKSYHLVVRLFLPQAQTITTHDFTFQVDSLGNIFNLQTQNLSYVENKFGVQTNDVSLKCNTIILNHRRLYGPSPQDPKIQGDL